MYGLMIAQDRSLMTILTTFMAEKARELCQSSACTIWLTSATDTAVVAMKSIFMQDTVIRVVVSTGLLTHFD